MHNLLNGLPEAINRVFDALELIAVRLVLLGLIVLSAHRLFFRDFHLRRRRAPGKRLQDSLGDGKRRTGGPRPV